MRRIEREHHAFAAQHDVVRLVGPGNVLEVEHLGADVGETARRGALLRDVDHVSHDIRDHNLAVGPDALGRGQSCATGAARQLEHPVAAA